MKRFQSRVLLPVVGVSACLLVLGGLAAASLIGRQAHLAEVHLENLNSRRAAIELDECLTDVLLLLRNRTHPPADPPLDPLHQRAREHLADIRLYADQQRERSLADDLEGGFRRYEKKWNARPKPAEEGYAAALAAAADTLDADVLRPCRGYKQFNAERIDEFTHRHDDELRTLGWGMAGIGVLGGGAGVVFGYGLARAVRRSLRGVQVRIRDASGRLGPDTADVTVAEGEFGGLHADLDQLSERVGEAVERLHQREREVRRAEQLAALGQLAAGVAHEIRNPLTAIKLLVQSAQGGGQPLGPDDLAVIEAEVRRMEGSLRTFLDYARPPKPDRRPTEVAGVVRRAFDLLRPRAERQRVGLVLTADRPVSVTADENQLHQAVVNLGLNALDAMPAGGTLSAGVRQAGGVVEVVLTDTGPGIPADILPRLFQPFASGKDTGLGLGLVIARRTAEDHGGTLAGTNRPAGGAAFTLTLPAEPGGG